jgi:hypothetical protein
MTLAPLAFGPGDQLDKIRPHHRWLLSGSGRHGSESHTSTADT